MPETPPPSREFYYLHDSMGIADEEDVARLKISGVLIPVPSGRLVDREAIDREAVAAVEHDQWAHWTAYMLDNLSRENIVRWSLQIETPYAELTEVEKESDRKWAAKAVDAALGEV